MAALVVFSRATGAVFLYDAGMKVEAVKIEDLIPDQANARKHDERNISAIAASLQRFGQQKPIVVDSSGVVRAGNGTLYAAQSLGWKKIDMVRSGLENAEAAAYAIADNRTAELAEWDTEVLASMLDQMDAEIQAAAGFSEQEIAEIMAEIDPIFEPGTEDEQGKLDELKPKIVTCPECSTQFDARSNE